MESQVPAIQRNQYYALIYVRHVQLGALPQAYGSQITGLHSLEPRPSVILLCPSSLELQELQGSINFGFL